jgi:hypothetical protein
LGYEQLDPVLAEIRRICDLIGSVSGVCAASVSTLKLVEICCFYLIDIESVASRSLKAVRVLMLLDAFTSAKLPTLNPNLMS